MKLGCSNLFAAALLSLSLFGSGAVAQASPAADGGSALRQLPAEIPVRRDSPAGTEGNGQLVFAMWSILAIGVLIWVVAQRLRKVQRQAPGTARGSWRKAWSSLLGANVAGDDLRVIGAVRLGPRHSVHVVEWKEKTYLVGCSEQGLILLDQSVQTKPAEAASAV